MSENTVFGAMTKYMTMVSEANLPRQLGLQAESTTIGPPLPKDRKGRARAKAQRQRLEEYTPDVIRQMPPALFAKSPMGQRLLERHREGCQEKLHTQMMEIERLVREQIYALGAFDLGRQTFDWAKRGFAMLYPQAAPAGVIDEITMGKWMGEAADLRGPLDARELRQATVPARTAGTAADTAEEDHKERLNLSKRGRTCFATLDGTQYELSEEAYAWLCKLYSEHGGRYSPPVDENKRPGKLKIPTKIRAIINTKAGHNGGSKLTIWD
jgi:hypothetical protein